jgi:putative exporter of polyketide antibiotics
LDSFFLSGLATIGLGLAPFFLKLAWSSVVTFFGQVHSIRTWRDDELAQYGHEILSRHPEVKE